MIILNVNNKIQYIARPNLVIDYRGVKVYDQAIEQGSFLFVHNDIVITERVGVMKAFQIINDYLDSSNNVTSNNYHAYERMQNTYKEGVKFLTQ